MKTIHFLVYTTLILLGVAFYFHIFIFNPQIKTWIQNNPFVPPIHHIDTTQGPITHQNPVITQPIQATEINYSDTIRMNNIRALFKNGNDNRYVDGSFDEFPDYQVKLANCLYHRFSHKQLKTISSISLIGWDALEGNTIGQTQYSGGKSSFIDIAAKCRNVEECLYHEIIHALYFQHYQWFNDNLKYQWMLIDDYISLYATTDIAEDIAETGAHYLEGDTINNNEKFKLIASFLAYTK